METTNLVISILSLFIAVIALNAEQRSKLIQWIKNSVQLLDVEIKFQTTPMSILNGIGFMSIILGQILIAMLFVMVTNWGIFHDFEPYRTIVMNMYLGLTFCVLEYLRRVGRSA